MARNDKIGEIFNAAYCWGMLIGVGVLFFLICYAGRSN